MSKIIFLKRTYNMNLWNAFVHCKHSNVYCKYFLINDKYKLGVFIWEQAKSDPDFFFFIQRNFYFRWPNVSSAMYKPPFSEISHEFLKKNLYWTAGGKQHFWMLHMLQLWGPITLKLTYCTWKLFWCCSLWAVLMVS